MPAPEASPTWVKSPGPQIADGEEPQPLPCRVPLLLPDLGPRTFCPHSHMGLGDRIHHGWPGEGAVCKPR